MTAPREPEVAAEAAPGTRGCPHCAGAPPLEVFRRDEVWAVEPLRYCPRCYGFWAQGDALAHGVVDSNEDHPALRAVVAPARCRECLGFLDDLGACRKCGWTRPALQCPRCATAMARESVRGVAIDRCGACGGTWFDVGEISRVYEIPEPLSLVARVTGTTEPSPGDGELLIQALWLLARIFVPFL